MRIIIGQEGKPVKEGIESYKDSIFKSQYENAFRMIRDVADEPDKDIHAVNNNIIAFCGERGAGKTSCMESVCEMIKDAMKPLSVVSNPDLDHLKSKRFHILDTIDPSFFDNQHNILDILVGTMYDRLQMDLIDRKSKGFATTYKDTTEIMTSFQLLQRHIPFVEDRFNDERYDSVEKMGFLAKGVTLKAVVSSLVVSYLKYFNQDYLIIPIDDIDLNVSQAYKMSEQIRKYLVIPNVIILIAVKDDQLIKVVEQEMAKGFSSLYGMNEIDVSAVRIMAERYVNKFIPFSHRVVLPSPEAYLSSELEVIDRYEKKIEYKSLREAIPDLIFKKTRYMFYNTMSSNSMVIPLNLRDLNTLVSLLWGMNDLIKNDNRVTVVRENQLAFKQYFFSHFLPKLSSECYKAVQTLRSERDLSKINKLAVKEIVGALQIEGSGNVLLDDILDENNTYYNVSFGDVFRVIDYAEKLKPSYENGLFLFVIKSMYSFYLYDSLKYPSENVDINVKRESELDGCSQYDKIVAGGLITSLGDDLIASVNGTEKITHYREIRLINGKQLTDLIKELVERQIDEHDSEDFKKKLLMAEFFMLSTSRFARIKNDSLQETGVAKYRKMLYPVVYKQFGKYKNLIFDVLYPLFSTVNIKRTYDRFDGRIYDIAKNVDGSIAKYYENSQTKYMLQVRNVEIIEAFFNHIKNNRDRIREGDTKNALIEFYRGVNNFSIDTYEKDMPGYQPITLDFRPFMDALLNTDDSLFKRIFDRNDLILTYFLKQFSQREYSREDVLEMIRNSEDFTEDSFGGRESIENEFSSDGNQYKARTVREKLKSLYSAS